MPAPCHIGGAYGLASLGKFVQFDSLNSKNSSGRYMSGMTGICSRKIVSSAWIAVLRVASSVAAAAWSNSPGTSGWENRL